MNNEKIKEIRIALCLINSMIYSGEYHSETSEKVFKEALAVLAALESEQPAIGDNLESTEIFNQIKKHLEIYFATAEESPTKDSHIDQVKIWCNRGEKYIAMLQRLVRHYELSEPDFDADGIVIKPPKEQPPETESAQSILTKWLMSDHKGDTVTTAEMKQVKDTIDRQAKEIKRLERICSLLGHIENDATHTELSEIINSNRSLKSENADLKDKLIVAMKERNDFEKENKSLKQQIDNLKSLWNQYCDCQKNNPALVGGMFRTIDKELNAEAYIKKDGE
jgi:regulator of replication initiation timing